MRSYIFAFIALLALGFASMHTQVTQAQDALTPGQVEAFIASFPDMNAIGARHQDEFEDAATVQGDSESPFLAGIDHIKGTSAYDELNDAAAQHGFDSLESWGMTADRILRSYLGLQFQGVGPEMQAAMAQAMESIENNPDLTPEQKAEYRAQFEQAMGVQTQAQENASPEDMAVVAPYQDQLTATFQAASNASAQ